jgi:drug/metabolite transporter (DMT)-like permease
LQSIRQPTPLDLAKLIALGAIWASAFMCIEIALRDFSPLAIAAWRILIGTIALAPLVLMRSEPWPRGAGTWAMIVVAGLLYNAIPFTLISWGQQYIASGMAAILMSCGPFIALALSHLLTKDDRFTLGKLFAVSLGFSGVALLIGVQALTGSSEGIAGQLAMVAAVTCYVLSSLVVRRLTGISPLMISLSVLMVSAIYMTPTLFALGDPFPESSGPEPLIALVFLGLVPTGAAYILRVQIAQQVGATFLSQVSYVIPVFGLFWSWLFLGQVPRGTTWFALILILGGLIANRAVGKAN